MNMRFLLAALSIAGLLVSATVAKADKRVAFVVGNGAYKNVAALPNPAIDAKSMAKVLRNVGFDVVEGTNLTRDKMTERLLEFGKKANIAAPGVEIQQAMTKVRAQVNEETNKNQLPWDHTNLIGSVYLNPAAVR
jgi:uncharacterized caspase-like protein